MATRRRRTVHRTQRTTGRTRREEAPGMNERTQQEEYDFDQAVRDAHEDVRRERESQMNDARREQQRTRGDDNPATGAKPGAERVHAERMEQPIAENVEALMARAIADAEVRGKMLQRARTASLHFLLPQDVMNIGNQPFVTSDGWERLRGLWAVSITDARTEYKDITGKNGAKHVLVTCSGTAHWRGDAISVIGTRQSNDPFFTRRSEWVTDANGQRVKREYDLPLEEIDLGDVAKAAHSNMIGRAIGAIIGLAGLTWEQMEAAGFDRKKAATVSFREAGERKQQDTPRAAQQETPRASQQQTRTQTPPPPPQEPKQAPAGNGEPQDNLSALRSEIGQLVGGDEESDLGTRILERITAYTRRDGTVFTGFYSWRGIENNKNPDRIAAIARDKLAKALKDGSLKDLLDEADNARGGDEEVPF